MNSRAMRGAGISRRQFVAAAALSCAGACSGLAGCSGSSSANMAQIEDMAGRSVSVPQTISRVFCTNPIGTADMYCLAPEMIAGWNFLPSGDAKKYIEERYLDLPSLGVWMGSGAVPNQEEIAAVKPDVLLCFWTADDAGISMADDIQGQTGIPTLVIDYDLRNVAATLRYLGTALGCEDHAAELAAYCESKLELIRSVADAIPQDQLKSIYLAQGNGGLTTDPVGSMHVTDALDLVKTRNVADMPGTEGQGMGMPSVNLEQVITWNPDAILVSEFSMSDAESSDIYHAILDDSHWNNIPCVAAGQVFRIPQAPFSWFGRPPSVARILGCLWVLKCLYPAYSDRIDLRQETIDFYQVFYRYEGLEENGLLDALLNP